MMVTKGSILDNNNATISEKKIQSNQTVMCMKSKPVDDYINDAAVQGPIGPVQQISDADLNEKVEGLLTIFPEIEVPLLKFILQKKNYSSDEVAMVLLDPSSIDPFRSEMESIDMEQNRKNAANKERAGGPSTVRSLSATIANQSEYFELFFQLLKFPISELQSKVWNLLSSLPLNAKLYEKIRSVFDDNDSMHVNWRELLDSENSARLLYSLQIMSTFIICSTLDENEQAAEVNSTLSLL